MYNIHIHRCRFLRHVNSCMKLVLLSCFSMHQIRPPNTLLMDPSQQRAQFSWTTRNASCTCVWYYSRAPLHKLLLAAGSFFSAPRFSLLVPNALLVQVHCHMSHRTEVYLSGYVCPSWFRVLPASPACCRRMELKAAAATHCVRIQSLSLA